MKIGITNILFPAHHSGRIIIRHCADSSLPPPMGAHGMRLPARLKNKIVLCLMGFCFGVVLLGWPAGAKAHRHTPATSAPDTSDTQNTTDTPETLTTFTTSTTYNSSNQPDAHAVQAADKEKPPVLISANQMTYDEKNGIVTAEGHVEVGQGEQVLQADKITYNQKTGIVQAKGHVAVLQPSGDVMFADEAQLTGDMKEGFVEKVSVLFSDNSRLAANDAQKFEGRWLIADNGIYSACNLCAKNPRDPPLWQIRAKRVTHDAVEKNVMYRDAVLEMAGIPVFYTPYLSHPDPTVNRRQGFLTPSGGTSQYIGSFVKVPYYFDIAPETDLTLTPTFSSTDKLQMAMDVRHRLENGNVHFSGSFTHADFKDEYGVDKGEQWRGHIFENSLFELSNTWRAGTEIAYASDKSYLYRYNISSLDELTNRAYAENFKGRNYAVANLFYFQDLRPGLQLTQPLVTPEIRYSALGAPGQTLGGRWSFDSGLLVTSRDRSADPTLQGPDTRRLDFSGGWQRQLVSDTGFLTDISGFARMDGYWADNVPDLTQPTGASFNTFDRIRPFAQTDLMVRYPLGRRGESYQQIIEPIVLASLAPRVSSNALTPNEDSQSVDFDETNLFEPNRYNGVDRLEGGTRFAYGIRHGLTGDNGARIEVLLGQVFRTRTNDDYPVSSGLRDQFSDYVGRIDFTPNEWFDSSYRFRINPDDLGDVQRQELDANFGATVFRPYINYLLVRQTEDAITGNFGTVEETTVGAISQFAKYWTVRASYKQAFQPDPGPRLVNAGVDYIDECFQFGISAERNYTNRADLDSGTTVMFHFYLKNIGGVHTDAVTSGSFNSPSYAPNSTKPSLEQ